MDWSGCELVEVIPGKVSGRPIVVGTRIPADLVIDYFDHGTSMDEFLENYPGLSKETVERLLSFANSRRMQVAS
jgi:uncharacterized protein (DUF433 family)